MDFISLVFVDHSIHILHCQVSKTNFQPCVKGKNTHLNKCVISYTCVVPISQTIIESSDHSIIAFLCHIDFQFITCWACCQKNGACILWGNPPRYLWNFASKQDQGKYFGANCCPKSTIHSRILFVPSRHAHCKRIYWIEKC